MDRQVKQVEFAKLRFAYVTVKNFIEDEAFDEVTSLRTKIAADLGMSGDDNYDFLIKFVKKFELDHKDFIYEKHFYTEMELYDSTAALINLLSLSIWIPLKTLELLTLNKIHIPKPGFYKPPRKVTDMTFKDLLTWYIEGKYVSADEIKYEIKRPHNII
jgi:hypothetical protein